MILSSFWRERQSIYHFSSPAVAVFHLLNVEELMKFPTTRWSETLVHTIICISEWDVEERIEWDRLASIYHLMAPLKAMHLMALAQRCFQSLGESVSEVTENGQIVELIVPVMTSMFLSSQLVNTIVEALKFVTPRSCYLLSRLLCYFTKLETSALSSNKLAVWVYWMQVVKFAYWIKWEESMSIRMHFPGAGETPLP